MTHYKVDGIPRNIPSLGGGGVSNVKSEASTI